jgi:hypothetical protein
MAFYRQRMRMFGDDEDEGTSWLDLAIAGLGLGTAIAGAVGGQPTTPAGTPYQPGAATMPPYVAPKPAISTTTILLLGGAAVAVLFLMKK